MDVQAAAAADLQSAQLDVGPSLDRVPDDVLLEIWNYMDDPAAFSQLNKRLRSFSMLPLVRARWFLQRYQLYESIFYAIARPKLFDEDLLDRLLRGKASLSRLLVQLLQWCRSLRHLHSDGASVMWGRNLTETAYSALRNRATSLYGDVLEPPPNDSLIMERWLRRERAAEEPWPPLIAIIRDFKAMPLPINIEALGLAGHWKVVRSNAYCVETSLLWAPQLAPLFRANGFVQNRASSLVMCRTLLRVELSPFWIARRLGELQDAGVLQVPREIAVEVFSALRHKAAELPFDPTASQLRNEARRLCTLTLDQHGMRNFEALRQLSISQLAFNFHEVAREILDEISGRTVQATEIAMLHFLGVYFPTLVPSASHVQALLLEAELQRELNVDIIADFVRRHLVRPADIMVFCLRSDVKSATSIRFAIKHIPGFAVKEFLEELVEALLHQPYRGLMIRVLNCLCESEELASLQINFHHILAEAVERKAFTPEQLPQQEWTKYWEEEPGHGPYEAWVPARFAYTCNKTQPVRSLLSFVWKGSREGYGPEGDRRVPLAQITNGPTAFRSFTRFVPSHGAVRVPLEFFGDERFSDVWTGVGNEDESVALAIVEILGGKCRAADVIVSHCILNGNNSMLSKLLELGVTLTLQHIKIAFKVGHSLAPGILTHLARGAPFKASFDSPEGQLDSIIETVPNFQKLTKEENRSCVAARGKGNNVRVLVDVDESGLLRVENKDDAQAPFVQEIVTRLAASLRVVPPVADGSARVPTCGAVANVSSGSTQGTTQSIVWVDGLPKALDGASLTRLDNSLTLWIQHLERLDQLEMKKWAALRVVLQPKPAADFDRDILGTALGGIDGLLAGLRSAKEHTSKATPLDKSDPIAVDLALLFDEQAKAEGLKAAQFVEAAVRSAIRLPEWKYRWQHRRRAYTRALHSIRSRQDTWPEILAKAEQRDPTDDPRDDDFESDGDDESSDSDSNSDDEPVVAEPARKRAKTGRHTEASGSAKRDKLDSRSKVMVLVPLKRSSKQTQREDSDWSSSSDSDDASVRDADASQSSQPADKPKGKERAVSAEEDHPVYKHPLFDRSTFEFLCAQADGVGQRRLVSLDRYEEELMREQEVQLRQQKRWGPPPNPPRHFAEWLDEMTGMWP